MNWEWFNTGACAASIVGLIVTIGAIMQATITGRATRRLQADIHAATQATMADIAKGFRDSQSELGKILERMDERWRETFERLDQQAEERYRDLRGRLDGEA